MTERPVDVVARTEYIEETDGIYTEYSRVGADIAKAAVDALTTPELRAEMERVVAEALEASGLGYGANGHDYAEEVVAVVAAIVEWLGQ